MVYGNALAFNTFAPADKFCFNFSLLTQYSSIFRQTSSTSVPVQTYVPPKSRVSVVSASGIDTFEFNQALGMVLLLIVLIFV